MLGEQASNPALALKTDPAAEPRGTAPLALHDQSVQFSHSFVSGESHGQRNVVVYSL